MCALGVGAVEFSFETINAVTPPAAYISFKPPTEFRRSAHPNDPERLQETLRMGQRQ